jgi:pyruvate formate lyase activating enzyme
MTPDNIISLSTVDWIGRAATIIFLPGCPMCCRYCHNHELIHDQEPPNIEQIKAEIKTNSTFISGVVFSGGECFTHPYLLSQLAKFTHDLKLLVAVQTNGYFPDRIRSMIEAQLLDLICLDVKAPLKPDTYTRICGIDAVNEITQSLQLYKLCHENNVDFEVRTTVFPGFIGAPQEIRSIARSIRTIAGDVRYVIQMGNINTTPVNVSDREFTKPELIALAHVAHEFLSDVRIRTKESGEESPIRL